LNHRPAHGALLLSLSKKIEQIPIMHQLL